MEGEHPQRGRSTSNRRVRELTERSPKASSQDRPEALRYCRYHSRNQASAVRVIVDTNVLVSAIFFGRTPGRILDAWRTGQIDLVVSQEIVDEKVSPSCPLDSLWTGGFEIGQNPGRSCRSAERQRRRFDCRVIRPSRLPGLPAPVDTRRPLQTRRWAESDHPDVRRLWRHGRVCR